MWYNVNLHRPDDVDATRFTFRTWYIVGIIVLEFCTLVKCIQSQNIIKIILCPDYLFSTDHSTKITDVYALSRRRNVNLLKCNHAERFAARFNGRSNYHSKLNNGASALTQHCKCIVEDANKLLIFSWRCAWWFCSSAIWHRASGYKFSDVQKELTAFLLKSLGIQYSRGPKFFLDFRPDFDEADTFLLAPYPTGT